MLKFILFALIISFHSILNAAPAIANFEIPLRIEVEYQSPTRRFTEYYNYELILQSLRANGMSLEHRNFFEHIIPHEELGFFGYHSSTQGFRIYQDIIRILLEEICGIPIKKDFHFLRIPGKPLLSRQSALQFLNDYPQVHDGMPDQQEQLLSMNYALFGNFNSFGSCSVAYFTKNMSATTIGFQNQLTYLFDSLGISTDVIADLFSIGQPLMNMDNAVLFQFFDFSHHNAFEKHYGLVDQMCYDSRPLGVPNPFNKRMMSEIYLKASPSPFSEQFRIVINNALILNPYSPLHIKRFERNDPALVKEYEATLREAIKNLLYDKDKAMQYKKLLLSIWGQ